VGNVSTALGIGMMSKYAGAFDMAAKLPAAHALEIKAWQLQKGILETKWTSQVKPDSVWAEYPRPMLARKDWINLNGLWDYRVSGKSDARPSSYGGQILVPFPIESPLSGVMQPLLPDQKLWYRRSVTTPDSWKGQRVLLHFGAVDWQSTIYIDGKEMGSHRGGYDGFSLDVTGAITPGTQHEIVVEVWDPSDTSWNLHGKQTLHPAGCSYTASSGIWQTVWLEPVPQSYIERLVTAPDLQAKKLRLTVQGRIVPAAYTVRAVAKAAGKIVADVSGTIGAELASPEIQDNLVKFFKATNSWAALELELPIKTPKLWSPDSPFLYDLTVILADSSGNILDTVESYFGMRSVKLGTDDQGYGRLFLNGEAVLLPGALDQGFWPDGVYLAPTDDALRYDIEWAKELGLNTLRKHVKIECQRWYYWADKLGILVFQDMPTGNCGDPQTDRPTSPEAADQWRTEVSNIIQEKYNHPSIVCWTPFNEAFGGFDYIRNAAWVKSMDSSRLINESSGVP